MFSSPFGPGIALSEARLEGTPPTLLPEEAALVPQRAVPQRRIEFALGRAAARQALLQLGLLSPLAIMREPNSRAPLWPNGFVGSITHKGDIALALVARSAAAHLVGIDLEVIAVHRSDITSKIAAPCEIAWVRERPDEEPLRIALLFSAKECLYKALYPRLRTPLSFQDVCLTAHGDAPFEARLAPRLAKLLPGCGSLLVHHARAKEYILTMCVW